MVIRHDKADKDYLERAKQFPQVCCLNTPKPNMGMATLIHPQWLLTAAHCEKHVRMGDEVVLGEQRRKIEKTVVHPTWATRPSFGSQESVKNVADLALLKLSAAVGHLEPLHLYEGCDEKGSLLTLVGKGMSGTGLTGVVHNDGHFRAATNVVERVLHAQWLEFRFDEPPYASEYEGASGKGDSGGPALMPGNTWSIAGVASWEDSRNQPVRTTYGVLKYYVRTSYYADWIKNVIKKAALS